MRFLAYAVALSVMAAAAFVMWPAEDGSSRRHPAPLPAPVQKLPPGGSEHGEVELGLVTLLIASLQHEDRAGLLLRRD